MVLRGPVLVGTDLSDAAAEALLQARQLASGLECDLVVCHILPELFRVDEAFPQFRETDTPTLQSMMTSATRAVRAQLDAVLGEDAAARVVLDAGTPHAGLLTQAADAHAGLIVVGAGDTAKQVVRHASVPVLIARPSPRGVVLGATDFSDPSLPALEIAASEAARRHAKLHLVHALDVEMYTLGHAPEPALPYLRGTSAISMDGLDRLRAHARQKLADMLAHAGVAGEATVASGHAVDSIIGLAETAPAEVIVVGTHGRTGLARLTLGSTAEAVIDRAPCSVLVVRLAKAEEQRQAA